MAHYAVRYYEVTYKKWMACYKNYVFWTAFKENITIILFKVAGISYSEKIK